MEERKIYLRGKRADAANNPQGIVRLRPDAYAALVEITNETNMSIRAVASEIITQAVEKELIAFERPDGEEG